jgi:hypothetical protein
MREITQTRKSGRKKRRMGSKNLLANTMPLKCQPPALNYNLDHVFRARAVESKWRPFRRHIS